MSTLEPSRVGSVVASKYRLDEELGRGGMGAVYRAFHLRVHKVFALKMLLGDIARHRSLASRFLLEAQAAGRIGHPGILEVYDVGEDADGTPFIVMELLRGEPLSNLVRRERLDVDAACWIASEVLDVLDAAHKAGIVHRDVKPQNVFVTERPALDGGDDVVRGVKLLDFGIAKFTAGSVDGSALTRSGEIIGSPLYMAPEQAKGEPDLDERADVWSVGAMLFEMLTGQCAHVATTPVAVLAKILTEEAPAPSARDSRVPPALDDVVRRALRIDRAARWPSARAMRDALSEVRLKLGAPARPKLPASVKTSTPPPSNDRTPGAITSTVAAPSEPPRPWSHAPTPATLEDAAATESALSPERVRASAGEARGRDAAGSGDPSSVAARTTVPSAATRSLRRKVVIAGASLVALVALAPRLVALVSSPAGAPADGASRERLTAEGRVVEDAPSAPTTSSAAIAATRVESTSAPASDGQAEAGAAAAAIAATTTTAAATAASAIDAGRPAAKAAPTGPRCSSNEVASNGHCCAKGLEWQNGRCERPLATTF